MKGYLVVMIWKFMQLVKLTFGFWDREMVEAFRIRDKADGKSIYVVDSMIYGWMMVSMVARRYYVWYSTGVSGWLRRFM